MFVRNTSLLTLITEVWPWQGLAEVVPRGDLEGRQPCWFLITFTIIPIFAMTSHQSPWMMELFLAGTLSGVGCSSPVGWASTGMGPGK